MKTLTLATATASTALTTATAATALATATASTALATATASTALATATASTAAREIYNSSSNRSNLIDENSSTTAATNRQRLQHQDHTQPRPDDGAGSKLYIAMEFMEGGAVEKLMKPKAFEEMYVAVLMREILKVRSGGGGFVCVGFVFLLRLLVVVFLLQK
jgi:hypothetical protein